MSYCDHERFQTHCRFCFKILEADTAAEAIGLAEAHEKRDCPKHGKPKRRRNARRSDRPRH
jgi:hypothetical protein